MIIKRRNFLKGLAGAIALSSVSSQRAASAIPFNRNLISILMGPAFDGDAEFSAVHSQSKKLIYQIYLNDELIESSYGITIRSKFDDFKIDKFIFHNLPIDQDLVLKVNDGKNILDQRVFKSISSSRTNYNIGKLSCMRADNHDPEMWESLESQHADVLLFLGDCVYADYAREVDVTPQVLWKKFVETRMLFDFYQWQRLVPTIAIWDDHDFGGDNSDNSYNFVQESQRNFKNFYAQELSEGRFITPGSGISVKFKLGSHLFLMLDGRSFRDKINSDNTFSMFGREQEEWIFDSIKNHEGLIWLCNGSQWFNEKKDGESFISSHKNNFLQFIEKLNQEDKSVIFVSGDVHYSEVRQTHKILKNESIEITSSCMHSSNFIGLPALNKNSYRLASAWNFNYIISQAIERENNVAIDIQCFTRKKRRLFQIKKYFKME